MKHKIRKFGNMIIALMFLLSFVVIIMPVQADGSTEMGVLPSADDVSVGDTFYATVYLNPGGETVTAWKVYSFSFSNSSLGICNATDTWLYGFWHTGFDEAGSIHNDTGTITSTPTGWQSFSITGTGSNQSHTRINFTALKCGIMDMKFDSIRIEDAGGSVTNHTRNDSVTVHPTSCTYTVTPYNYTQINLTAITAGNGCNTTVIRGSTGGYPASPTDGSAIYNGTGATATHSGLTQGQTWYYSAWSYNVSENIFSLSSTQHSGTTPSPFTWYIGSPSPANASTTADGTYNIAVSLTVGNSGPSAFNWYVNCSNAQSFSDTNEANGSSIGGTMTGLSHGTLYYWNVSVNDGAGGHSTSRSYHFTTGTGGGSSPGSPGSPSPSNHAPNIPVSVGTFSCVVTDPDGDAMNTTFYLKKSGGSYSIIGYDDTTPSGGTASLAYGGPALDYDSTYEWYVVDDDGILDTTGPTWDFTTQNSSIYLNKEWELYANNSMLVYINVSNTGATNFTNVVITETYHDNVTFSSSNPAPASGDRYWKADYLNISGYTNNWYNITIWLDFDGAVNGSDITNSVNISHLAVTESDSPDSPSSLSNSISVVKEGNRSWANETMFQLRYYINVTNTGDFNLTNVTVTESYSTWANYSNSNIPPATGSGNTIFYLDHIASGQTKTLWIDVEFNTTCPNGTRIWNNITVTNPEKANTTFNAYTSFGGETTRIRIIYDSQLTNVGSIGDQVFAILGVVLILASILLIVGVMYAKGLFHRGEK